MEKKYEIAVAGGDLRLTYLSELLAGRGYRVACYGLCERRPGQGVPGGCTPVQSLREAAEGAAYFCGGIPFSRERRLLCRSGAAEPPLEELYEAGGALCGLFGGVLPEETESFCRTHGIQCVDFMKEETMAVGNAVLTAEGAILEALSRQPGALHRSRCLVLGYGRCGRALADKLLRWPAFVTVCARDPVQRAWATAAGAEAVAPEELDCVLPEMEYIFQTIPAPILDGERLRLIAAGALLLELASQGGSDEETAKALGIRRVRLPGLPGKYAPGRAAEHMAAVIETHLGKHLDGSEAKSGRKGRALI